MKKDSLKNSLINFPGGRSPHISLTLSAEPRDRTSAWSLFRPQIAHIPQIYARTIEGLHSGAGTVDRDSRLAVIQGNSIPAGAPRPKAIIGTILLLPRFFILSLTRRGCCQQRIPGRSRSGETNG